MKSSYGSDLGQLLKESAIDPVLSDQGKADASE